MSTQQHLSDPRILGRRTLERDHRCLAGLLTPGMAVLDVGCGTGAITAGIARAVGREGEVVGIDRAATLLEQARAAHGELANLRFECADITESDFTLRFDIVTAARAIQWIANPSRAIAKMRQAARPDGLVVVLDYNHQDNRWEPDPPPEFQTFYRAFLAWREANGWDNRMADHLPELFRAAGLIDIRSEVQDEVTEKSRLWPEVMDSLGAQLVASGHLTAAALDEARAHYDAFVDGGMRQQILAMRAVVGRRPDPNLRS